MNNSELTTKPTLETILERINVQGEIMRAGFATIEKRLEPVEKRLEQIEICLDTVEIRLDRVQSMVLEVRADVKEFVRHSNNPR